LLQGLHVRTALADARVLQLMLLLPKLGPFSFIHLSFSVQHLLMELFLRAPERHLPRLFIFSSVKAEAIAVFYLDGHLPRRQS